MLKVTLFLLSLVTALWGLKLNFLALKHPPGAQEVPTPLMVMAALSMLLADWRVCGSPIPKLALGDYYDAISTRKRPLLYLLWCYCLIMVVWGIFNSDGPLLGSTLVLGMAVTANLISLSDS